MDECEVLCAPETPLNAQAYPSYLAQLASPPTAAAATIATVVAAATVASAAASGPRDFLQERPSTPRLVFA